MTLPPSRRHTSLRELEPGMDEHRAVGVDAEHAELDQPLVEPELLLICEELNRRKATVLFHPTGNGICSQLVNDLGPGGAVGTSLEDTLVAMHLIARKIPSQVPNITFIVPHLGGPVAMLLQRLHNQFSMASRELPEPPSVTA